MLLFAGFKSLKNSCGTVSNLWDWQSLCAGLRIKDNKYTGIVKQHEFVNLVSYWKTDEQNISHNHNHRQFLAEVKDIISKRIYFFSVSFISGIL